MAHFSLLVFIFINAIAVICSNITAQTTVQCSLSDTLCSIECSQYRSCLEIYCNNATECHITCSGSESCYAARIYHTSFNKQLEINCANRHSCDYLQLQYDPAYDTIITNNKSLIFNAFAAASSESISLSGDVVTFSNVQISCDSLLSCSGMQIELNYANFTTNLHNLTMNMNIMCNGIASCQYLRLYVSDMWLNSLQTTVASTTWDSFIISLYCNNTHSCMHSTIDTQALRINSLSSTASFADLYIYCENADSACLYMNVICPELVPFKANYDYLYQDKKCHFNISKSYQNHISIVSHHGIKMIDLECKDDDDMMCDGITLYCSEDPNSYFCSMQMKQDNNTARWFCDNFEIFYVFNGDYNYSYGCDEYLWYDTVAIIETSKIPDYDNKATMRCSKYNPLLAVDECYMHCDTEWSCLHNIFCDNSTVCHISCTALNSCKDRDDWSQYIHCPSKFVSQSSCFITLDPMIAIANYGDFYVNFFVSAYHGAVQISTSHNMLVYLYDNGVQNITFNVLNSDNLVNWTKKYDMESWWRIRNRNENITAPLSINVLCDRCYTDWFEIVGYEYDTRNVSVHLSCIECTGTEFAFWGITSFSFDCVQNCSHAMIQFTDSNADLNCYDANSCDGVHFITNPWNYSDYIQNKYVYNLNLFNISHDINLFSLYGFDTLHLNCAYDTEAVCDADILDIHFYCGAPDYFKLYHSYDAVNESQCLQFNPLYSSAMIALHEYEFKDLQIRSQIVYCEAYWSCSGANITCLGDSCVLHCNGIRSCSGVTISANYVQDSLIIYCRDYKACRSMNIHGNDVDYIEINCMAGDSCDFVSIYYADSTDVLPPSKGLNVTCYDISSTQSVLPADDIYFWPACKRLDIYCPQAPDRCHINLVNGLYTNPWDIDVYFARGFAELNLNCFYNPLNNESTCHDVEYRCKLGDSKDPYNVSNYVYQSTFNEFSGECMGGCCDFIYSHSPTTAPTNAPTMAPSLNPTFSPTRSPTAAPTRMPTSFEFNAYFIAKFYIDIVADEQFKTQLETQIEDVVLHAVEYAYLYVSTAWSYSEYLVNITNFTYFPNKNKFNITTQIYCDADVVSHYVQFTENNDYFDEVVVRQLQMEWNVTNITFDLYPNSFIIYAEEEDKRLSGTDYTSIAFISFTCVVWFLAILSFLHSKNVLKCFNKLPKIQACDDQQYASIISFGMQILDVFSDLLFACEMVTFSKTLNNKIDRIMIRILYSFSFIFCFIPYVLNLLFALKFQKMIDHPLFNKTKNKTRLSTFSRNYFFKFSRIIAIFAIISGSVSSTLQLVNSHLFGHEWFIAGFSRYRLSKMRKFRIMFNVILENTPQFIIQMVYFGYFTGRNDESVVSFTFMVSICSSVISILSCIMAYCLQREYKPEYQTRFNIEITLATDDDATSYIPTLERTATVLPDGTKRVIGKHIKKLHKKSNMRKVVKDTVAKCVGRLKDNFELLYCVQTIEGLTVNGLCSSDGHKELSKLFSDHQSQLRHSMINTYALDEQQPINKYWKVQFFVFDFEGKSHGFDGVECGELNRENQSIRVSKQLTKAPTAIVSEPDTELDD